MHVFEVDPRQRITVPELAERVKEIERWTSFDATTLEDAVETVSK